MKNQIICVLLFFSLSLPQCNYAQNSIENKSSKQSGLFSNQDILAVKLHYSNKDIKKETNDSTYIKSSFNYKVNNDNWTSVPIELRSRGNFRLKTCYFAPIKVKIKKSNAKSTIFEGHKKLKLVLPCLIQKDNDDNVIKEFMAYKLYEIISPYYYKTRLLDIAYTEIKGKKTKEHQIKGFIIEDDKVLAKRIDAKVLKANVHPLEQDPIASLRNDFFQFMIGNTDFSAAKQHNEDLFYVNNEILPVPYDFDMSGLVNASYALVGNTQKGPLKITSVTQRQYRGFKRNPSLVEKVKNEFIENRIKLIQVVTDLKPYFENENEYDKAYAYITSFFEIVMNASKFNSYITAEMRDQ